MVNDYKRHTHTHKQNVFTRKHRCRLCSLQRFSRVTTREGRGGTSAEGGWIVPRSFVWSRHSKATASCLSPLGQRHSCTCASERQGTSNYGSYYTSIQRNADKRACFQTGNAFDSETGRHATATRTAARRRRTDWQATRQRRTVVPKDRRGWGGRLRRGCVSVCVSVVSIFDNNGGDVIIGSLIKINLISATHNIFCLLKRCLASLEARINARLGWSNHRSAHRRYVCTHLIVSTRICWCVCVCFLRTDCHNLYL